MTSIRCVALLSTLAIISNLGTAQTPPNPYREVVNWAKLPEGTMWGHVFGVGIDSHRNVWALDRCGGSSCVGSNVAPIH